jgi:DNA mismatch endonuclease (patch repair protein)
MVVRRIAHGLGYRFRLHRKDLPGSPDLVFPAKRIALFVHGCFWHRHDDCRFAYTPKSNENFWTEKFSRNVERDRRAMSMLRSSGWTPVVIWECETKQPDLAAHIERLLKEAA